MIAQRNNRVLNAEAQRRRDAEISDEGRPRRLNGCGLRAGVFIAGRLNQRKGAKAQRRKAIAMIDSEAPERPCVLGCCTSIQGRRSNFRAMPGTREIRKNQHYFCDDPLLRCCAFAPLRLCVQPPTGDETAATIVRQRSISVSAAMSLTCAGSASLRLCASALIPRCASALSLPVRA